MENRIQLLSRNRKYDISNHILAIIDKNIRDIIKNHENSEEAQLKAENILKELDNLNPETKKVLGLDKTGKEDVLEAISSHKFNNRYQIGETLRIKINAMLSLQPIDTLENITKNILDNININLDDLVYNNQW